ncbi:MAG: TolC family protein [Sedimentisphaerales bacterium]|nr:TolC family protein [Sedimentisphaerales bacterium]
MNRHDVLDKSIIALLVIVILLSQTGCEKILQDDQFYELSVPQEKLQTIKSLPLTPKTTAPTKAELTGDPNSLLNPPPSKEVSISLEEFRASTLRNNLELQVQLIAPTIAQENVNRERAKFEAAFFTNTNFIRTDRPGGTITEIPGSGTFVPSITSSQNENIPLDIGVYLPLQTGGTLTFDLADSRFKNLAENSLLSPWYENTLSLSLSQPLLRGAGTRANLHSIRVAEYNKQITDNLTKLEVIRILAETDRVYWRLYAARKQLEVRLKQYKLAEAQLERAKRFVEAGEQPKIEILRAQAGISRYLADIINTENTVRDRQRELKRFQKAVGLITTDNRIVIPTTEPNPMRYELEPGRLVDLAFENRREMLDLELQLARNISEIDFQRNAALPLVLLDYTYGLNGTGPRRKDSLDMVTDKNFENHRLGVRVTIPLGNEAAKATVRQTLYQRRQLLADQKYRRLLISTNVVSRIDAVETRWQQILAARQSALLEGKLYEAEIRQFTLGLRTSTDVLEAQTRFANAQSDEINALVEYEVALVDLAYETGTLLGAAQVQWAPLVPEIAR